MKSACLLLFAMIVLMFPQPFTKKGIAQNFAPPKSKNVDPKDLKILQAKTELLSAALASLKRQGLSDRMLIDIEVYQQAAVKILKHNEFFQPDSPSWTADALDRGSFRARFAANGSFPWLPLRGHTIVHGYRSIIDGSVQPYAVTLPFDYGKNPKKKWRIDVVLHGRDKTLSEIKFLFRHNGDNSAPQQNAVRIDVYGRGNNAYRWAGEKDVLEAVDAFLAKERNLGRDNLLDLDRIVLRGFSMGGAGAWHLGLHMPGRWCVIGPGAGFTRTHGYVRNLPPKLAPWQEACLHIYDAVDYAENVFNVPAVAYAGSKDRQLQAAKNIEERLNPFPFANRMQLLVAPGLAHRFPKEWQQKAENQYQPHVMKGRSKYPKRVRFVTYTLKYPRCFWLTITGLQKHYAKALVDAEWTGNGYNISTQNVYSMNLALPELPPREIFVHIDKQKMRLRPWTSDHLKYHLYLVKRGEKWKSVLPQLLLTEQLRKPRKVAGIQGPIDDAFTVPFLCVRGTGKPWHIATAKHAEANLNRFAKEWSKFMRGELPIKDDVDVNARDIAEKNLVLFGDPSSNSVLADMIDGLPLDWNQKKISFAGNIYTSSDHVPVMIYPSPVNAQRYVVLNSGHTFHTKDFLGTNALLYPRLGDYAMLKLAPKNDDPLAVEVRTAGLFDENWQIGKKTKGK